MLMNITQQQATRTRYIPPDELVITEEICPHEISFSDEASAKWEVNAVS